MQSRLSSLSSLVRARHLLFNSGFGFRRWRRTDVASFARRLAHFFAVWPLLLSVHEAGHAMAAWRQGIGVRQVTVGVGPALWRGEHNGTQLVLRLVPVVGLTKIAGEGGAAPAGEHSLWSAWWREGSTLAGGVAATLALAVMMTMTVAMWERGTRRRWLWGRIVVADAIVLTVFNFLPVPPLDGGRAVLGALVAARGAPLSGDALFWIHLGGLALAVVPMALWTRWTARIDRVALSWRAPVPRTSAVHRAVTTLDARGSVTREPTPAPRKVPVS